MARRSKRQGRKQELDLDRYTQVDIFYIPNDQAEMYRVLREVVAQEAQDWFQDHYPRVSRVSDDPEEGEALVAYDQEGVEVIRYYLNPDNITQAQEARDKGQLAKHLEHFLPEADLEDE